MAKSKYFHVKHNTTGAEKLVKAARPALAIQAVSGGKGSIRPAGDEEIHQYLVPGGSLHDKSCPEGEGKLFFVHSDPLVLIRAKNAAAAFQLLNDGAYSVETATQDALVRLITAGVAIIDADVDNQKAANETNASSSTDGAGTDGTDGTDATEGASLAAKQIADTDTPSADSPATTGIEADPDASEQKDQAA